MRTTWLGVWYLETNQIENVPISIFTINDMIRTNAK